jgi:spermidine synthase
MQRAVLYLVTFMMGGIGLAYEYTLSKIASDLLGNSTQQWAVIIGVMMLCMGVGSDLQKHFPDKKLLDRFVQFETLLGLAGGFGPVLLLLVFGGARDYFALVQYALTVGIGLLIGMEIPVLARINEHYTPLLRVNLGGILRMDYLGAFAGALVWVFVLTRLFSLTELGFFLGFCNIAAALIAYLRFRRPAAHAALPVSLLLLALAAVTAGGFMAPAWSAYAEQRLFRDRVVFSTTTPYQHIVMTRRPSGEIFCYINGNLQFSSIDEHIYHELLVHPAMLSAPRRRRVLVLGGGDGLAVREILKYDEVEAVTVVDIDPAMIELARTNPYLRALNRGAFDDSRVAVVRNRVRKGAGRRTVICADRRYHNAAGADSVARVTVIPMDAASFVARAPGVYDVIIADFPDPTTLEVAKLYSKSFYRNIGAKLARNGLFVQQSSSPFVVKEAYLCIGRTARDAGLSVVPYHANVPTFGEWGWWIGGHGEAYSGEVVARRLAGIDTIPVPVDHITPAVVRAALVFGKGWLRGRHEEVNTLLNNALFYLYRDEIRARQ